jgi:hypothetical protein
VHSSTKSQALGCAVRTERREGELFKIASSTSGNITGEENRTPWDGFGKGNLDGQFEHRKGSMKIGHTDARTARAPDLRRRKLSVLGRDRFRGRGFDWTHFLSTYKKAKRRCRCRRTCSIFTTRRTAIMGPRMVLMRARAMAVSLRRGALFGPGGLRGVGPAGAGGRPPATLRGIRTASAASSARRRCRILFVIRAALMRLSSLVSALGLSVMAPPPNLAFRRLPRVNFNVM